MNLTGIWKAIGCTEEEKKDIIIQDGNITFTAGTWNKPFEKTGAFNLVPENVLQEAGCQKLNLIGEDDDSFDFIVHEEMMDGKQVILLSEMTMEYDGRGRIVGDTYVREADLPLVGNDFVSKARQFFNKRKATPTDNGPMKEPVEPMGFMGMGAMMGGMMPGMMASQGMPAPSAAPAVEPWDCTCGAKHNGGRFCPECGNMKPQ